MEGYLVAVASYLVGGGLGGFVVVSGEQEGTAGADLAGDREADAAGTDDCDDFLRCGAHVRFLPIVWVAFHLVVGIVACGCR